MYNTCFGYLVHMGGCNTGAQSWQLEYQHEPCALTGTLRIMRIASGTTKVVRNVRPFTAYAFVNTNHEATATGNPRIWLTHLQPFLPLLPQPCSDKSASAWRV